MVTKAQHNNAKRVLAKLRKKYDKERFLRDEAIEYTRKRRMEIAKYTFADLDSGGKNPFIMKLKSQEKFFAKRFKTKEAVLNKLDQKINKTMFGVDVTYN